MRKKIIASGIFILIAAAFIWVVYFFAWPYYQSWKIGRDWQAVENELTSYFKSDTYGGATPQETYDLYVAALKRGDLESASRYFYFQKEDGQKAKLQDLAAKGELQKYIDDLPKWEEMKEEEYWDKDGKQYSFTFIVEKDREYFDELLGRNAILEAGTYSGTVTFQLNKYANIWKIYSL
ncbi:MAG: hypothetical protein V1845_03195 [bacterium]